LDIDMPGLGGMETLKLIRKEPKFASLPVLMCTGRNALGTIDDALEDGATGYLIKPFDFTMLAKKVSAALSAKA
jgi:CheY-like chemotaxis protein